MKGKPFIGPKKKDTGPILRIKVIGDGWISIYGRRPRTIPDKIFHSERWRLSKDKKELVNVITRRKSKRRHPDMPSIPLKLP